MYRLPAAVHRDPGGVYVGLRGKTAIALEPAATRSRYRRDRSPVRIDFPHRELPVVRRAKHPRTGPLQSRWDKALREHPERKTRS